MKVNRYPCIEAWDLEREMRLQYDVDIEMRTLFWLENNNCFEIIGIDEEVDEDPNGMSWGDSADCAVKRNLVRAHLRDLFPEESFVLVEVSE